MSWWERTPWWMRTLAAIGAYATAVEILKRTADLGRRRPQPSSHDLPAPGTEEFVRTLSRALGTPYGRGGEAHIYNNGDEFFPALFEAVADAEHHVHMMTYIWEDGRVSDRLIDLLQEKIQTGVEVRILVDGIGGWRLPRERSNRLRAEGAKIHVYAPPLSADVIHLNRRNHRRAMVVDGRIGFTGGMSISDRWLGKGDDPNRFRDTMIGVQGPMAHAVQWLFVQLWTNIARDELVGGDYFPEVDMDPEGNEQAPLFLGLAQTPAIRVQPLRRLYWLAFRAARERIYASSGYFAPDPTLRDMLKRKAREGLDVRLLLPGPHTDNPAVRWSARLQYDDYLKAGVRIFEYQPGMLHAKHILIDNSWVMVGSADVGVRSFKINHEGVLGVASDRLGRRLRDLFESDFDRSREIRSEQWRRRGAAHRVRERISALLQAQY